MKFPFLTFLLLSLAIGRLAFAQSAESYYVLQVKGRIVRQSNQQSLKTGDVLSPKEALTFRSPEAAASVVSTKRGRFTLGRPAGKTASASTDFVAFVSNVLAPAKVNGQLSSRGTKREKIIDLPGVLGEDTLVIPGATARLPLDAKQYPMNQDRYFMFRYEHGGRVVKKRMGYVGDTLLLNYGDLYTAGGQTINSAEVEWVDIYYVNLKDGPSSVKMASIRPVCIEEKALTLELQTLAQALAEQKLNEEGLLNEMEQYVRSTYGRTDRELLESWNENRQLLRTTSK